jgi:hypothetical protein
MTAAGNRVWNEVVNIHLRRIAELEQELAKTDAMLREYMLLGTVENFATLKAENARLRLFAGAAPRKEGR